MADNEGSLRSDMDALLARLKNVRDELDRSARRAKDPTATVVLFSKWGSTVHWHDALSELLATDDERKAGESHADPVE